ncbi:hypothetical protein TL16_g02290 [Triparma laevis f. inornata]|uniref:Golgi SNAP receptor complex member 1 n=1 Tax=Triparma laevis f. inornata TaxID=1714386 RepID=A0A9W6ZS72_9STRA|nr:hypothetical protein TL16_g02290 [Triparma laevis f. inornata]
MKPQPTPQVTQRLSTKYDLTSSPSDLESGPDSEDTRSLSDLSTEITTLLSQLDTLTSQMKSLSSPSGQQSLIVKRFTEISADFRSDYNRRTTSLQSKKNRYDLLSSSSLQSGSANDSDTSHLLRERTALNSSLTSSHSIINQASEIFTSLKTQRVNLQGSGTRVRGIASNVPGINQIVEGIKKRKQRDNMILGAVIAFCVLFTMWYMFG